MEAEQQRSNNVRIQLETRIDEKHKRLEATLQNLGTDLRDKMSIYSKEQNAKIESFME